MRKPARRLVAKVFSLRLAEILIRVRLGTVNSLNWWRDLLPLDEKIERTQRLLRRLEADEPLLALRVADLGKDHQRSAKKFAAQVMARTRAELQKLIEQKSRDVELFLPAPAD